jgi:hypothetical protein
LAARRQENICRFEIAMNQAARMEAVIALMVYIEYRANVWVIE